MDFYEQLKDIFEKHHVEPEAQREIRLLLAIATKDCEKKGYSDGWNNGFESCER